MKKYPKQFWLMFVGIIFSTTGTTMIWPFLMIYVSEKLALPYTAITSLMTINAITGLTASILAGPIIDRYGRKWIMVLGLLGNSLVYFFYSGAQTYWHFAILMGLSGIFSPFYRVGTDAMLTDMFAPEDRMDAFALIRMGRNIGMALGPALGGFVLAISYSIGLYAAALAMGSYGVFIMFFIKETLVASEAVISESLRSKLTGYLQALKDGLFMRLVGAFALVEICAALVWVLLSVYLKTNFNVSEGTYGWIPTTNALMVVFLQVLVTSVAKKYRATHVMAFGGLFYTLAMVIIASSSGFWGFWLAMVVMTFGELMVVPTATTYIANLAPVDKRGRYMSLYGLTWHVATGISPLVAGILSDQYGLRSPWIAGILVGALSVVAFLRLKGHQQRSEFSAQ